LSIHYICGGFLFESDSKTPMSLDKQVNKFIGSVTGVLETELPKQEKLDDYVDFILEKIGSWGHGLSEKEFFIGKRWLEVRDQYDFVEDILHIFNEADEYLISIDGNIITGKWRLLAGDKGMIIEQGDKKELYDLAYLDENYLILRKHGDQMRRGQSKYFVLATESSASKLSWHQLMDELYNVHRGNVNYTYTVTATIVLIIVALILSII
jgi:hypothetical protein